jgi:Tfp pilus assembly protein PilN
LDEPVQVLAPPSTAELAALTAERAARAEPKTNLLPQEFATRYQQQFVDRLWMRGLAAVVGLYLIGVFIYLLALGALYWKTRSVETRVASLANTYTNAIQLKARYQVLKDRQELKFAALDCWKAVADVLPESLTLDSFKFNDGRRLSLNGTAPAGSDKAVLEFYDALRKTTVRNQPLFDAAKGDPAPRYGAGPGGNIAWNFSLELKRTEGP